MKTLSVILALFALTTSACALASTSNSSQSATEGVVQYRYGMKLDIDNILSKERLSDKCGTSPVIMTYQDSNGAVHKLAYSDTLPCLGE